MTQWWGRYIGLPFEDCNCWALVRRVYRDHLGIDLPEYGEISDTDLLAVHRKMKAEAELWITPPDSRPFDVALMATKRGVSHVGIVTRPLWVLHTEKGSNAVHVPVSHLSLRSRIVGYRRWPQ
jgi:cell wall-associated NlpC family hydrolase